MRIEIIGGPAVEFIPLAQFATDIQTYGNDSQGNRRPANRAEGNRRLIFFFQTWQNNHCGLLS